MKRKILLFSSIIFAILLIGIVSAQMCEVGQMRETLRKALFDYLPAPALSKLNIIQIRDLLDFYLNVTNQTIVNCSIKANLSQIPYELIIQRFNNLIANVTIPECIDATKYGKCSLSTPRYCYAGKLVDRCDLCGCPSMQTCQKLDGKCYSKFPTTNLGDIDGDGKDDFLTNTGISMRYGGNVSTIYDNIIFFVSEDRILKYYNIDTKTIVDSSIKVGGGIAVVAISNNIIAFTTYEGWPIYKDLNGDGDTDDIVLSYYNINTGKLSDPSIAGEWLWNLAISDNIIAFASRRQISYYDINTDAIVNTPLTSVGGLAISNNIIAFATYTPDYNIILQYYDINTKNLANPNLKIGRGIIDISNNIIAFTTDFILRYYNINTNTTVNVISISYSPSFDISGNIIVFVSEDGKVRYYDIETKNIVDTGINASSVGISNNIIVIGTNEALINQDLNEDGDINDTILRYITLSKFKRVEETKNIRCNFECSIRKPIYCDNGNLIDNCQKCSCPEGQACNSTIGSCYILKCSDGTLYNQCSATKPLYCDNGTLVNKCNICGCSSPYSCLDDKTCRNIFEKEKTLTFSSAGTQTVYLRIPKNMTVKNAEMNLTSSAIFSTLDAGNDTNYEWSSYLYDAHEREWSGSCSELARWKGWLYTINFFPLAGKWEGSIIDELDILIKPAVDITFDKINLNINHPVVTDARVTGKICKVATADVISLCNSTPITMFSNYSIYNISAGWLIIPLNSTITLTAGTWKIMFENYYPNPNTLPFDDGVAFRICGFSESGTIFYMNSSGTKLHSGGSPYIKLVKEESIQNLALGINEHLANCILEIGEYCLIPFVFTTNSTGTITISNVNISYKKPSVTCESDSNCGTSSFVGDYYCKNGSVYENYLNYTCLNSGTFGSNCISSTIPKLIDECAANEYCQEGKSTCQFNSTCSDNILSGKCSATKPLYCSNGTLINNCTLCGCPSGQTCLINGSCEFLKPILNMSFECDAKDNSGYGNDGTIYGARFVAGKVNTGLSFDGIDDYVDTKDINEAEGTNVLTLEAWVKPEIRADGVVNPMILAKYYAWNLHVNYNNNGFAFSFNDGGGWATDTVTYTAPILADTWYYVVARYDGSTCKIFVNGDEAASAACSGSITSNSNTAKIGQWNNNEWFNGTIDEVKIYPYALTAEQIQIHYQSELSKIGKLTCKCSDGTPYWNCSSTKPRYCDNGNLISNCSLCGCPSGQNCDANGSCYIPQNITESEIGILTINKTETVTINTLSDGSSEKELTFENAGNQIVYIEIPKDSNAREAEISLNGSDYMENFSANPSLDIGDEGNYEWAYSGNFSTTETTQDFSTAINNYLTTCTPDAKGNCSVPLVVHSDSAGTIKISDISITATQPITSSIEGFQYLFIFLIIIISLSVLSKFIFFRDHMFRRKKRGVREKKS